MGDLPEDFSDLVEHWTLLESETDLVAGKHGATRLGLAARHPLTGCQREGLTTSSGAVRTSLPASFVARVGSAVEAALLVINDDPALREQPLPPSGSTSAAAG